MVFISALIDYSLKAMQVKSEERGYSSRDCCPNARSSSEKNFDHSKIRFAENPKLAFQV